MLDDLTRPLRGGTWEDEDGHVQCSYSYELVINYLREDHSIRLVEELDDLFLADCKTRIFRGGNSEFPDHWIVFADADFEDVGIRLIEGLNND